MVFVDAFKTRLPDNECLCVSCMYVYCVSYTTSEVDSRLCESDAQKIHLEFCSTRVADILS